MPVVVIGGGLTAIDTATESLAYYVVQVEKFLDRYETLVAERGEREVRATLDRRRDARPPNEFHRACPRHSRRARRGQRAKAASRDFIELLNSWGGVTIAYRRRLIDSPSYTLNHEEVAKALRRRHPFRRMPDARSGGGGSATATPRAALDTHRFDEATSKLSRDGEPVVLPARIDSGRRRHAAEHGAGAAKIRTMSSSMADISRPSTKTGSP